MAGDSAREVTTARALVGLPAGTWRALQVEGGTGRRLAHVEHLVVGPPGVFVVGSLDLPSDTSTADGLVREAALARLADSAIAVAELLLGMDPHLVVPVLCSVRGKATPGWARDVRVCTTGNLVDLLTTQEKVFEPADVDNTFDRLQRALPSASSWAGSLSEAQLSTGGSGPTQRGARSRTAPRESAKPLPWEPGTEVSPPMRSAIIGVVVCLGLCAVLQVFMWPVVEKLLALLTRLH